MPTNLCSQTNTPPRPQGDSPWSQKRLQQIFTPNFFSVLRSFLNSFRAASLADNPALLAQYPCTGLPLRDLDVLEFAQLAHPCNFTPGPGGPTSRLAPPTTLMADSFLTPTMGFTPFPAPIGKPNPYRLAPPNTAGSHASGTVHIPS